MVTCQHLVKCKTYNRFIIIIHYGYGDRGVDRHVLTYRKSVTRHVNLQRFCCGAQGRRQGGRGKGGPCLPAKSTVLPADFDRVNRLSDTIC